MSQPVFKNEPIGLEATDSYWIATSETTDYPALSGETSAEVCIIGGGIAGITAGYHLARAGVNTILLESGRVLNGVTGKTTAKITSLHGPIYHKLIDKFSIELAGNYARANQEAIDQIESLVTEHEIDCNFYRQPFYLYATSDSGLDMLRQEMDATIKLEMSTVFHDTLNLPFKVRGGLRIDGQAQFHPRRYLLGLLRAAVKAGLKVFENSRVTSIQKGDPVGVRTADGGVGARHVFVATNFPVYDRPGMIFARIHPVRSYVVAAKVEDHYPGGMYLSVETDGHSLRAQPEPGGEMTLIIGGEEHKPGQGGDNLEYIRRVSQWARDHFRVREMNWRWSTQDNITIDMVPYIGRITDNERNIYIATGFHQWGMTNGTVAGGLITDLILGRENPYATLFDPSRFKPAASARELIVQNAKVGMKFVKGKLMQPERTPERLQPGQGGLIKLEAHKAAAYRDETGRIHAVEPKCAHMGCDVQWNNFERSWDCPCHGSRFGVDGEVLHAPTMRGLEKK